MESTSDQLHSTNPAQRTFTSFTSIPGAKIPPSAVDIERAVLGALMIESEAAHDLQDFLFPEHFYEPVHRDIYEVIRSLVVENRAVDILTVHQRLIDAGRLDQVGGAAYLTQLTTLVGSGAHVVEHAKILIQKYLQRELIRIASEIQRTAYDGEADVDELIESAEQNIFELRESSIRRETQGIDAVVTETLQMIEEAQQRGEGLTGLASGFSLIDEITMGWQKGDLIIVAARPAMGKTAFVLTMARNMAVEHGAKVAFFSLEMPSTQLIMRLLVAESGIDSKMLRGGKLSEGDWVRLLEAADTLSKASIFLDDTQALGIGELRAKCRRLKARYDIDLIIVDYLQLMTAPVSRNANREQEVSKISNSLKSLAKELDVPIVALAQLSRALESRAEKHKKPILSDLRESGSIEQDADIVAFIHRPEKLNIEFYPDQTPTQGIAEFVIAKHRNGETADVFLRFVPEKTQFIDVGDRVDHYNPAAGAQFAPMAMPPVEPYQSKINSEPYGGFSSSSSDLPFFSDDDFSL